MDIVSSNIPNAKGVTNNVYEFKSKEEMAKQQEKAFEKAIQSKKKEWIN